MRFFLWSDANPSVYLFLFYLSWLLAIRQNFSIYRALQNYWNYRKQAHFSSCALNDFFSSSFSVPSFYFISINSCFCAHSNRPAIKCISNCRLCIVWGDISVLPEMHTDLNITISIKFVCHEIFSSTIIYDNPRTRMRNATFSCWLLQDFKTYIRYFCNAN